MGLLVDEILVGVAVVLLGALISRYISKSLGLLVVLGLVVAAIFFRDDAWNNVQRLTARLEGAAPVGTVMYEANHAGEFAAWFSAPDEWGAPSSDWKAAGSMLINDGSKDWSSYIQVPYRSGRANYAVEAEIQVVRRSGGRPDSCANNRSRTFGIYFREERGGRRRNGFWDKLPCGDLRRR